VTASLRAVRFLLIISVLALTVGCKDKPKRRDPPPAVGSAGATEPNTMKPAPDLILPKGDGTPPKKTTKPHTPEDYERFSKIEFDRFKAEVRTVGKNVFEVRQKTKDFPRLWATVTIQHCHDCLPMELAKWKEKEEELKVVMGGLKDAKTGVESELGETSLNGQKLIYHHYVGYANIPGEGGGETWYGNAYVVYFNDGINEIRVIGEYKDDPVSVEDMKKLAPKDDLKRLALAFLDYYTHQW
jgi:hypothetical protein